MLPGVPSHTVPCMHVALELHARVQRCWPPCTICRHTSGDAQSASVVQRSSSCPFIVPPVELLLLLAAVVVLVVLVVLVAVVLAPLELDAGPLELEVTLVVVLAPAPLEDALPPPLPIGGTHCAFWSQIMSGGQSRDATTQFCAQDPFRQ
jgi:hypothetical protein